MPTGEDGVEGDREHVLQETHSMSWKGDANARRMDLVERARDDVDLHVYLFISLYLYSYVYIYISAIVPDTSRRAR